MTTIPSITTLPTSVPQTSDPSNFDARADAFLGALPGFVTQTNASIAAINTVAGEVSSNATSAGSSAGSAAASASLAQTAATQAASASNYFATSTTSLAIGTGAKAFTTQSGKSFAASGDRITAISKGSPLNRMRGVATYSGTTLTITVDETQGSGTFTDWIIVLTAFEVLPASGRQALWVPAAAMTPRTSSGAAYGSAETATNKVGLRTLDFDTATMEFAQFSIRMPKAWNELTVTFVPLWSHAATTTNFGVTWQLQARAFGDLDAFEAAFGTAQLSADTGGTTDMLYVGPESAAITIAGSPQPEDLVVFQIGRTVADANDTMAIDARLHGVTVYITTDAGNDA